MKFKDMTTEDISKLVGLATLLLSSVSELSFMIIKLINSSKELSEYDKKTLIKKIKEAKTSIKLLPSAEELDAK